MVGDAEADVGVRLGEAEGRGEGKAGAGAAVTLEPARFIDGIQVLWGVAPIVIPSAEARRVPHDTVLALWYDGVRARLIGSATVRQLMAEAKPARVVVVDNLTRGALANLGPNLNDSRLEIVRGDIRDAELVRGLTKDIDAVVHAAALRITACAENPREALEVMCIGSFNVVEGVLG